MTTTRTLVVLGGTGHVGSYLVPRLVALPDAPDVVCVSRGQSKPYAAAGEHAAEWAKVRMITLDREADPEGFVAAVVALRPHAIFDMICFTLESAKLLTQALHAAHAANDSRLDLFVHTGSIWAYGPSVAVPTREDGPHAEPLADYGKQKRDIANYLLQPGAAVAPFATTVFHPGHIVGRGWPPLNPQGHFDPGVYSLCKAAAEPGGAAVLLPNVGSDTLHHVHADDIASAFLAALADPSKVAGEAFSIVSPQALTTRGFATHIVSKIWPDATGGGGAVNLAYAPCPGADFETRVGSSAAAFAVEHVTHSPCCSVDKLERRLGFRPAWSSLDAVADSVRWMLDAGVISTIAFPGKG